MSAVGKKGKSYCKELLKSLRNKSRSLDVSGLCCGHKRVVGGSTADLRGGRRMEEEISGPRFPTVMVWLFC